jgi:hypothetical protein
MSVRTKQPSCDWKVFYDILYRRPARGLWNRFDFQPQCPIFLPQTVHRIVSSDINCHTVIN